MESSMIASTTRSTAVRSSPATMATTGGPPNRASARTTPSSLRIAWQAARGPGLVVEMNTYASIAIGPNIAAAEAAGLKYRFRYEMMGEALRQSLSPARLRLLTEQAAAAARRLSAGLPGEERGAPVPAGRPLRASSFDLVDHAVFLSDPLHNRIVEANRAACEMLGYQRDELLATPMSAIHPAELPQLAAWSPRLAGTSWAGAACSTAAPRRAPTSRWR